MPILWKREDKVLGKPLQRYGPLKSTYQLQCSLQYISRKLTNHVTLVCCKAVFSAISEASEVDIESILLSPNMIIGVHRALSFKILLSILVELNE